MDFFRYLWRVCRVAFTPSLSLTQNVIFIAAIVGGAIPWLFPKSHLSVVLTAWTPALSG